MYSSAIECYSAITYYSALKKNKILPLETTWMDLEDIMLSEIGQTEKDILYYITYMWNLKNTTDEWI